MREVGRVAVKRAVDNSCKHGIVKGLAKTGGEIIVTVVGFIAVFAIIIFAMASA